MDASTSANPTVDHAAILAAVIRPLPEAVLLTSSAGRILKANQAAFKLLGVKRPQLEQRGLHEFVLEDPSLVEGYLRNCARSGTFVVGTLTWRMPAGELPFRTEGVAVRIGETSLVLLRCHPKETATDRFHELNTELEFLRKEHYRLRQRKQELLEDVDRKKAALQASETHNRAIVEAAADGIITVSDTGIIKSFNPAAEQIFGYTSEELIGQSAATLTPDDTEHGLVELARQGSRSDANREVPGCRRDGTTFPMELSVNPVPDTNPPVYITIARDITERKERQAALEAAAAELADKANLLERTNRELDQFAYITSHDLKAPLRAIANLSQWLEEDYGEALGGDGSQQLQLLRSRVRRMESLIDGILQYSRIGRVAVPHETINVQALIDEVIENLAPPTSFTVQTKVEASDFSAPKILLGQVLANLISNAIKYHDRPDGRIDIAALERDACYEFSVRDDGPGIDPKYHEKIFTIFQTLEARDKRESTGIGLTIVKKIIEEHGGELSLESKPGTGSTFRFTWPKSASYEASP